MICILIHLAILLVYLCTHFSYFTLTFGLLLGVKIVFYFYVLVFLCFAQKSKVNLSKVHEFKLFGKSKSFTLTEK